MIPWPRPLAPPHRVQETVENAILGTAVVINVFVTVFQDKKDQGGEFERWERALITASSAAVFGFTVVNFALCAYLQVCPAPLPCPPVKSPAPFGGAARLCAFVDDEERGGGGLQRPATRLGTHMQPHALSESSVFHTTEEPFCVGGCGGWGRAGVGQL